VIRGIDGLLGREEAAKRAEEGEREAHQNSVEGTEDLFESLKRSSNRPRGARKGTATGWRGLM
jgi:hypothetical protein